MTTWCPWDAKLFDNVLVPLYENYYKNDSQVVFLSVLLDPHRDPNILSYAKEHNINWAILDGGKWTESQVAKDYGVTAVPTTFILKFFGDTRQTIYYKRGYDPASLNDFRQVIETAKKEGNAENSRKPGEPIVDLYAHKTNVQVGEELILYLSVVNPVTSPGNLTVQLTLKIPSGLSITSAEFSPTVGGLQTAVYQISQGSNPHTIGVHILANQPFEGVILGYLDYYFWGQETKYHKTIRLPIRAELQQSDESVPEEFDVSKEPNSSQQNLLRSIRSFLSLISENWFGFTLLIVGIAVIALVVKRS
jgi:cytochrome oxidase Cu insertion factor (SCO1/SenC/PrrC family)